MLIQRIKNYVYKMCKNIYRKKGYYQDLRKYNQLLKKAKVEKSKNFVVNCREQMPMINDKYDEAGTLDSHYFFQDLVMAREINHVGPKVHYDIGSRVDGFITHILSADYVRKIILIDIRPLSVKIDRVECIQEDAISLESIEDESIESLSSLSVVEHFGLGRYGDPINPDAWYIALKNMQEKIKEGGRLYLSVPVGPEDKLIFNAHRIFKPSTIVEALDRMDLISFRYIHDMKVYESKLPDGLDEGVKEFDCGLFIFCKERKHGNEN